MTKKAASAKGAERFEQIPNVGPRIAEDLRLLGLETPRELIGQNPYALYGRLCQKTRTVQDPCVLDVFIAITRFMQGGTAKPWWTYTEERKAHLARSKAEHLSTQAEVDRRRRQ